MKIRQGFVSNSSSSSFVIRLEHITAKQLVSIQNHNECPDCENGEGWSITVDAEFVKGYTSMDNFNMFNFLERIGIENIVKWND